MKLLLEPYELVTAEANIHRIPIDCRSPAEFSKGHIPGAVNYPASDWIDRESPRGQLLPWEQLADALGSRGIGPDSEVVMYDNSGLVPSARLLWILDVLGISGARVLDGGFAAYVSAGLPVEREIIPRQEQEFPVNLQHSLIADADEILGIIQNGNGTIIDTRSAGEYSGEIPGALHNGHIPGAIHLDWQENISDLLYPRFKPVEELSARYENAASDKNSRIICYCRSGNRSAHTYLSLKHLGYTNVANYPGSWLEWGNNPELPFET